MIQVRTHSWTRNSCLAINDLSRQQFYRGVTALNLRFLSKNLRTPLAAGSKRDAEKLAKNVVKIVVKIALLGRNDQFSQTELALAAQLKTRFRSLCMTIVSFHR